MCGIAGVAYADLKHPVEQSRIKELCDVIRHRGPDEEGFYVHSGIGLGVRRLRIIDLATGQQPIHNEDKTVWTVFNGEIYNYRQLRGELARKGHQFYTQSDTEAIVHLYEEYGEECVNRLTGMFAFALWDSKRKRLLLARDRIGEKQLYYSVSDGSLVFGSEIKCLLRYSAETRPLDRRALREFFTYLYITGERTIFEGIRRLPPGHHLVYEKGKCSISRYWQLEARPQAAMRDEDAVDEFRYRFRQSVHQRLMSDVPLGAFLSGGIDSSAVVGTMAELSSRPVKTFTVGYEAEGMSYDERAFARLVAQRFGTDHHEFVVAPQIEDLIPELVRSFDEPFGDSSAVPSYYISKLTREHVTVALSGVGGDEVGGGYERYLGVLLAEHYKRVPRMVREGLVARLINALPDSRHGGLARARVKRFIAGIDCDVRDRYQRYVSTFSPEESDRLFLPVLREQFQHGGTDNGLTQAFDRLRHHDPLTQMTVADFDMYLPDDLLVLTDRLSMAHSLEIRAPFLDHSLLEFVATLPSRLKVRGWTKKYLLKKAFAPLLPREVLWRRKKGFSIPLAVWFRGALRPLLLDWLAEDRVKRVGLFDERFVTTLVREHLACRQNHENKLWALLIFMIWHDLYQ